MFRLRFTGTCDETEFKAKCAEHDFWYHSFYFDNGFVQRGDYNIGLDIDGYRLPEDMTGMSVLDVGTGSGWFATYFEQRGANVTTIDVRGVSDLDMFGRPGYPDITDEKPVPDFVLSDGRPMYYSQMSRGFWIMKDILGLKAAYLNARIYDLSPQLFDGKKFDLVFVGSVLMHLRDPIGALMAVRSVAQREVIATSLGWHLPDNGHDLNMTLVSPYSDRVSWWIPNKSCLVAWFRGAGFRLVDADHLVHLTIDKPYLAEEGLSTATTQTHLLVHATA